MCRPVTCPQCKKPDWAGCGAHIESVLGHVKVEERCKCREDGTRAANKPQGFFAGLFGR